MKELLLSIGAAILALFTWWMKDRPKRLRAKLIVEIEGLEDEAKLALADNDGDRLALIHERLRALRTKAHLLA